MLIALDCLLLLQRVVAESTHLAEILSCKEGSLVQTTCAVDPSTASALPCGDAAVERGTEPRSRSPGNVLSLTLRT